MSYSRYLKVPEGLFAKANRMGILKDIEFYYQLKTINEQGFLKKSDLVGHIQQHFSLSTSSIWRKIKRLLNLKFLRAETNGYSLVKYDVFYSLLGYQIKPRALHLKYNVNEFKLFKLSLSCISDIIAHIALEEFKLKRKRMLFAASVRYSQDSSYKNDTADSYWNREEFFVEKFKRTHVVSYIDKIIHDKYLHDFQVQSTGYSESSSCNIDLNITCQSFAELLGYKSSRQGHILQQRLVQMGYIEVVNRQFIYAPFIEGELPYGCFRKHGVVYKQLPNAISLL